MPMELLYRLNAESLPCELTDPDDIEKLRVLQSTGHVLADIPPWTLDFQGPARVTLITPLGLKAMRFFGPASSAARALASPLASPA